VSIGSVAALSMADESPQANALPPIRLNTIGYLPNAPKQATIAVPCGEFTVRRIADGTTVYSGQVTGPVENEDTEEQLFTVDFSALDEPGDYQLEIAGVGQSAPFRIDARLYDFPFTTTTRAMYLWRCGTAVHGTHDGKLFEHEACHLDDAYLDYVEGTVSVRGDSLADSVAVRDGSLKEDHSHLKHDGTRGWHDAGDYNKYVVNAGVTVGAMFRAWDEFGEQIQRLPLDLPESGGPLPDFLAELKWEIDWLLTMQAADGSVYHKLSTPGFCGFIMPEDEHDERYFVPWGSAATADFVAMTAMAARYFRPFDPAYADRCLAAARKSYRFLQEHPENHAPDQSAFSTGGYGTWDVDERLWAAAELWETTGDADVLADLESRLRTPLDPPPRPWRQSSCGWLGSSGSEPPENGETAGGSAEPRPQPLERRRRRRPPFEPTEVDVNWDWGEVKNLGLVTYLFSERSGRDEQLVDQIRASLLATADEIVATRDAHGYARPLGTRYFWGCNGTVARQVLVLRAAARIEPKPVYRETALDALNHLFGRNYYGRSFVTGLGDRPPLAPHDRRSAADEVDAPWPGYLVGGPHPTACDWHDEAEDYRTNEIAINWNGALIYALAAFLDESWPHSESSPGQASRN
jgi:endoglucanase